MMILRLRYLPDTIHKRERALEIGKIVRFFYLGAIFRDFPADQLRDATRYFI